MHTWQDLYWQYWKRKVLYVFLLFMSSFVFALIGPISYSVGCFVFGCRAMSRQSNMFTCWILPSRLQRGPCAASLRTTRRKMVLRFLKFCEDIWVEKISYPFKTTLPQMARVRNPRPSHLHFKSSAGCTLIKIWAIWTL